MRLKRPKKSVKICGKIVRTLDIYTYFTSLSFIASINKEKWNPEQNHTRD